VPESSQIEAPACHFVEFWNRDQKAIKSSILRVILLTSGANARKFSKSSFLDIILSISGAKARKFSNREQLI
jgi:hypothetical protein